MIKSLLAKIGLAKVEQANILLLFSMLLVISPHVLRIPVWLSLFCFALILWRLFFEAGKSPLPSQLVRFLLLAISIFGVLSSYHTIFGRTAGSAILIVLFCLKLTELKSIRDAIVIIFLGFFIVITGFLFSQSMPVAVYMFIVILALTTTLIALQHPSDSQTAHVYLAARMLMFSLPLAFVLFILFPRTTGPLWGLPEDDLSARTGISDHMAPGRIERLSNSDEVAFRVKFNGKPPPDNKLYWRGPVLWSFDGFTWTSPKKQRFAIRNIPYTGIGEPVQYTITLEPHTRHWLFALDLPAKKIPLSQITAEAQLISRKPVQQIKKYEMASYLDYHFYYLPGKSSSIRYTSIPVSMAPRTQKLVSQWKTESTSDAQIVKKALRYFAVNSFYYSRNPPLLFDDPVDEFIFETKKGYCEHFSSAFTFMMRAAGLPARVVTGYYGGELNPLGDYMIVRQSDAHAWSEVYLNKKGWVRIDPTSVIHPDRIENSADVVRIQPESKQAVNILNKTSWLYKTYKSTANLIDSINNHWIQWVVGYNSQKQVSLFKAFGIPEISWQGLTTMMIIFLGILVLVFSFYLLVNKQRVDPIERLYLRFCIKMKKLGFEKADNETAARFAQRIANERPQLKMAVMKITTIYNSLHYGKYQTKTMLQALNDNVKAL